MRIPKLKPLIGAISSDVCSKSAKEEPKKLLKVAIVGAPNVGKSTLLNRLVDKDISCVSKLVHTTRKNVLGVYTDKNTQVEFYDSPGVVTHIHLQKFKLEDSFLQDPQIAAHRCDVIAVVVDASNPRERNKLNKGVYDLLENHRDKKSILVLNKVDLVKEKRRLLEIGTRLTQGCLEGKCNFTRKDLQKLPREELLRLNILHHLDPEAYDREPVERPKHKYVIELDPKPKYEPMGAIPRPDEIGFKYFSYLHSISALNNDGVSNLRGYLMSLATPVEEWPHDADFTSNQSTRGLVHNIIKGQVFDHTSGETPYEIKFKYKELCNDDQGRLLVVVDLECSKKKHLYALIKPQNSFNITSIRMKSEEVLEKLLNVEVNVNISVVLTEDKS